MQVVYDPWLVLLSVVMAIQGAYVGFSLALQIGGAVGMRRRLLLAGAFGSKQWIERLRTNSPTQRRYTSRFATWPRRT